MQAPSASGSPPLRSAALQVRAPEAAIALGRVLLSRAREQACPWVGASVLEGRAVILGAAQRAGRVADMAACARNGIRVLRRATTGTAAYLDGRGILWQLALPHLAALVPDTSPRTLLNRNIRGVLRGFSRAGAAAHYFGREWISIRQRPAAIVGFDVAPSGEVLIEVLAGYDRPLGLPDLIVTPAERAIDRWLGKSPASLGELIPQRSPEELAEAIIESIAATSHRSLQAGTLGGEDLPVQPPVTHAGDPIPDGFFMAEPVRVPIGWVEVALPAQAASEPPCAWLGGDILAPLYVLEAIARASIAADSQSLAELEQAPIEGAKLADLVRAVEQATASIGGAAGAALREDKPVVTG